MMTIVLMRGIRVTGSKAGLVEPPSALFKPSVKVRLPWLHGVLWVYMVIESVARYIKNPKGKKIRSFIHWSVSNKFTKYNTLFHSTQT